MLPIPWKAASCFINNEPNRMKLFAPRKPGRINGEEVADFGEHTPESEANAEFVARAVNAHAKLLAACYSALEYLEANPDEYSEPRAKQCRKAIAIAESNLADSATRCN